LDEILAQLRANRDWLAGAVAAELPGVTMRVPQATYLAWLDCRALLSCPAGQFFLDQAKVGLNFGEAFGVDYAGFVRLNFATPAAILREIVRRMVEAVRRR
jgi:cystathionine beta-lyase